MAPDQNPEEDELIPLTVVDVLGDGTVVADRMTKEEGLTMTTPVEPGSPAPLRTIDQREQDEKNRIASARYNHTPGLRHTLKVDGATYDVYHNGAWHRITPRKCAQHHNLKNHAVARRERRGVV